MTIIYWTNFSKKRNSTKRPTGGTSTSARLKEPTSVESPVFILKSTSSDITYVQAMGHYYFVTDIIHVNNEMIEVHCKSDALATHKSEITASSQFVTRCDTQAYWNTKLIDESYPLTIDPDIYTKSASPSFTTSGSAALILALKGYNGTSFWAMRRAIFGELGDALYNMSRDQDSLWGALVATAPFEKTYLDPMNYITDARIIPIDASDLSGSTSNSIDVGYWSYSDPGGVHVFKKLPNEVIYNSPSYTLTFESRFLNQYEFMNSNKYRKYELILPGVGSIELDGDQVLTGNNIKIKFSVDTVGGICYEVAYGSGNIFKDYINGNISIPFAVHGQTADYSKTIGSATGVIGGIAGGIGMGSSLGPVGMIGGGIAGAVGGIAHAVSSAGPLFHTKTAGQDGSFARMSVNSDIILKETIYNSSGTDSTRLGAPCMQPVSLSNLTGYVQCMNAAVDIDGFASDRDEIIAYMNNGFYIE